MRPKISGLGAIDPFFGLAAIVPLSKTGAPGFRRGALRFIITGSEIRQIKIGVWRDDSRYPGNKLRALRKERGCGKRHGELLLRAA